MKKMNLTVKFIIVELIIGIILILSMNFITYGKEAIEHKGIRVADDRPGYVRVYINDELVIESEKEYLELKGINVDL